MDAKLKTVVETLLKKASATHSAPEAVNFSQAACNAANAIRVLMDIDGNSSSVAHPSLKI